MIFVLPLESCTTGKAIKHEISDVDQIVYFHFRIEKILYVHVHQSSSGSEDDSFFLLYPHTEKQLYIGIVFYSFLQFTAKSESAWPLIYPSADILFFPKSTEHDDTPIQQICSQLAQKRLIPCIYTNTDSYFISLIRATNSVFLRITSPKEAHLRLK